MCTRNGCPLCRRLAGPQLTERFWRAVSGSFGPGDQIYLTRIEGCYEPPTGVARYRER